MEFTTNTGDYLHTHATGYMVNTLLSDSAQNEVTKLQSAFTKEFGGTIWPTPPEALHITLLDWLAPLTNYHADKDILFEELYAEYDAAMADAINQARAIELSFSKLLVSPAAVAIVADDASTLQFNEIRQDFLKRIDLLPDTKQPPNIVHSTILRFIGTIALADVRDFAQAITISFTEQIESFQLVRETTLPMLEYTLLKTYPLHNQK